MRFVIPIVLWMALATSAFAQTLPICNERSGLEWALNTEPDVKQYRLFHGPSSGVTKDGAGVKTIVIPHDPSAAVPGPDGRLMLVYPIVLPEGNTFMAVEVSDMSGNASDLSNEVGCKVDNTPATPFIILRFTQQ